MHLPSEREVCNTDRVPSATGVRGAATAEGLTVAQASWMLQQACRAVAGLIVAGTFLLGLIVPSWSLMVVWFSQHSSKGGLCQVVEGSAAWCRSALCRRQAEADRTAPCHGICHFGNSAVYMCRAQRYVAHVVRTPSPPARLGGTPSSQSPEASHPGKPMM